MALVFVGGHSAGGTTATYAVDLTALTGGIASAAAAGDVVVVNTAIGDNGDFAMAISTAGYTTVAELWADGSRDTNQLVAYKVLATAETSVVVVGSNNSLRGGTTIVHVWRGEDTTTVEDVIATTNTLIDTGYADPSSIQPATTGAVILSLTASCVDSTPVAFTVPTDRTNIFQEINHGGSNRGCITTVGSTAWDGNGSFNPAALSGGEDTTQNTCAAVTMVLRPLIAAVSIAPGLVKLPRPYFRPQLLR